MVIIMQSSTYKLHDYMAGHECLLFFSLQLLKNHIRNNGLFFIQSQLLILKTYLRLAIASYVYSQLVSQLQSQVAIFSYVLAELHKNETMKPALTLYFPPISICIRIWPFHKDMGHSSGSCRAQQWVFYYTSQLQYA